MSDVTIPLTPAGSGVWQYQVPDTAEIIVKAVRANFDGSGIGSTWFPAVRIIAPGNVTDGEYPTDASVAAGGSATVDFFPGAEEAGGSSPPPSSAESFAIAYVNRFDIPTSPTGSFANFDPWDKIDSNDGALTLNGSGQIVFGAAGLYRVNTALQVLDSTWLGTDTMDFNFQLLTGGAGNQISTTWPGKTTSVAPNNPSGASRVWELAAEVWVNIQTTGEATRQQVLSVTGGAGHTATSTFAVCSILRVGDYSSGGVS